YWGRRGSEASLRQRAAVAGSRAAEKSRVKAGEAAAAAESCRKFRREIGMPFRTPGRADYAITGPEYGLDIMRKPEIFAFIVSELPSRLAYLVLVGIVVLSASSPAQTTSKAPPQSAEQRA